MQMLSKEPVRIRHNWDSAVVAECDFCSHTKMTVPRADSGRICASCCDSEFLSSWQGYAKSLETEILSLREQLACRDAMLFTAAKQIALGTEDVNSKVDITCHSCRRFITHQQHADADGFCPYCDVWMIRVQK